MRSADFASIDLFCGVGGMTQGFRRAGYSCVFANDHEKPALATFTQNHPQALTSADSIEKLDPSAIRRKLGLEVGKLDVLLGGPPCQGFSTYGRRDPDDHRNQMYLHFLHFLEEFKPRAYVIENVVGILSMENGKIIEDICKRVQKLGYGVTVGTLDAVEFGVPQFRRRIFITGGRGGNVIGMPKPSHRASPRESKIQQSLWEEEDELRSPVTVREAINDLPIKAVTPRRTQEEIDFERTSGLTEYQMMMRNGASQLTHHSAKQMLGIRRMRLALLRPGDLTRVG